MGLDIYLYRYDITPKEYEEKSSALEESGLLEDLRRKAADETGMPMHAPDFSPNQLYPNWDAAPEEIRLAYRKRVAELHAEHNLSECGDLSGPGARERVQIDSKLHPEHMFKVGYFRSSYNDSGIERLLNARLGVSLKDVFPAQGDDEYCCQIDWPGALDKAKSLLSRYRLDQEEMGGLSSFEIAHNLFVESLPSTRKDAFAIFRKEYSDKNRPPGSYSKAVGEFFWGSAFELIAAIPMTNVLRQPSFLLVGRWPKKEGDSSDWYEQALEIVVETCEWVLLQPNPERFFLHWSS